EAGLDRDYFSPDTRVAVFTGILCVATTLLFGVAPALRAASPDVVSLLKGTASRSRQSRRGALVVVQTAMCVLLLAVAAIFLRSMSRMSAVDPGFRAEGIVDVEVDLGLLGAGAPKDAVFSSLLDRAAQLPGVQSATLAAVVPLSGSNMETRIAPEGMTVTSRRDYPSTYFNIVGPSYFATIRTPVLQGREFSPTDRADAPRVAV